MKSDPTSQALPLLRLLDGSLELLRRLDGLPVHFRDDVARYSDLVSEIKVIAVRVVEVDRLLDEREADLPIEVERLLRVRADTGHVVEAGELHRSERNAAAT